MDDVTQLNTLLSKVRGSRLQYMLTNGDEAAAQTMQVNLDAVITQQQKMIGSFKDPENLKLIKEQAVIITNAQQSLNKMRDAYRARNSAYQALGANGEAAGTLIATIHSGVLQMPPGDADRFERLQAITRAKEQLLLTRFEVRGYIANSTPETEQKAVNQLTEAIDGLKQLGEYFRATQQDTLRQFESTLGMV